MDDAGKEHAAEESWQCIHGVELGIDCEVCAEAVEAGGKVIDLMAALKESLRKNKEKLANG